MSLKNISIIVFSFIIGTSIFVLANEYLATFLNESISLGISFFLLFVSLFPAQKIVQPKPNDYRFTKHLTGAALGGIVSIFVHIIISYI